MKKNVKFTSLFYSQFVWFVFSVYSSTSLLLVFFNKIKHISKKIKKQINKHTKKTDSLCLIIVCLVCIVYVHQLHCFYFAQIADNNWRHCIPREIWVNRNLISWQPKIAIGFVEYYPKLILQFHILSLARYSSVLDF